MASCSSCGAAFTCGMRETIEPCWCADVPKLATLDRAKDCLCPQCLASLLAVQQKTSESASTAANE
ncbi:MAG: cysteine-rich CWC family protein [Casimicrobiaceae bacterium]